MHTLYKYAEDITEEDLKEIARKALIIKLVYDKLDKFHWNEKDLLTYEKKVIDIQKEAAILATKLKLLKKR
ncbi:MAG: hypothetical protein ACR5KV_01480 [Wolbachia sp.]